MPAMAGALPPSARNSPVILPENRQLGSVPVDTPDAGHSLRSW